MGKTSALFNVGIIVLPFAGFVAMMLGAELATEWGPSSVLALCAASAGAGVGLLIASKLPAWRRGEWTVAGPAPGLVGSRHWYLRAYALLFATFWMGFGVLFAVSI